MRGYGNAWDRLSARWKAQHPLCGMRADMRLHPEHSECVRLGLRNPGSYENPLCTDHIVSKDNGGVDEESNFQSLCLRCNGVKAATVDRGIIVGARRC